ncbi:hypothetical protein B0T26DRAFT_473175 [Lasiosphaeria miniovina]|uniref:Uncharacterized protein n=1 Tax=Lasiosphaeria miniovina TaxID=1954250 RepID=A0AA40DMZ4_9PEZI|nr:uncharacterized protein B0T26DRAFT_473175 [Lasiosphaeria miniovina]KAK0706792.1 hypothetical protein B0T26DRAFT_473175 [Lasiosphaeria miniovina]
MLIIAFREKRSSFRILRRSGTPLCYLLAPLFLTEVWPPTTIPIYVSTCFGSNEKRARQKRQLEERARGKKKGGPHLHRRWPPAESLFGTLVQSGKGGALIARTGGRRHGCSQNEQIAKCWVSFFLSGEASKTS